jgi:hypothetical protein
MAYTDLVAKIKTYFPTFQVEYKDQSQLMGVLGKILFFNPQFMTDYTTTLGDTVYAPNEQFVADNQQDFSTILIHESVHMYDNKRLSILFALGYMFPQILSVLALLLFLVTWKIALPLLVISLLPLPAPWRTYFEQRAYFAGMYARQQVFGADPNADGAYYAAFFKDGSYYWMWPFGKEAAFAQEAANIIAGKPSCASEPELFQMVNSLIAAAKQ